MDAGRVNRRRWLAAGATGVVLAAGWGLTALWATGQSASPEIAATNQTKPGSGGETGPEADAAQTKAQPRRVAPSNAEGAPQAEAPTPMAQRVATIGFLNKRNGESRDLTMRPGQAYRIGDAIVRLRACEMTAPWEQDQLTGAFVQLDVRGADRRWRRTFSGWTFKERPSLNVVPSALYDVWPKGCVMRYPEGGAETLSAASPTRIRSRQAPAATPDDPATPAEPAPQETAGNAV